MITVNIHRNGAGLEETIPLDAISEVIARPEQLVWVDAHDPTPSDFHLLGAEFPFHALALEDAARRHQRPKIDFYDDFLFLVFYALSTPPPGQPLQPHELALFIGRNYVVTVHGGDLAVLDETRDRWRRNVQAVGGHDVGMLVYSILDAVVDGYFPVVDELSDRIEDLEEMVLERSDRATLEEIFRFKKDLIAIRRILAPERDVMNVLVRRDTPLFAPPTLVYFQDVFDHILRVTDAVDTYRDLVTGALDAYLSTTSNRLNQVMKTLTAFSIMLMSVTLVASIYGMNFVHMPELDWRIGYAWALGLMVIMAGALLLVFRRKNYL